MNILTVIGTSSIGSSFYSGKDYSTDTVTTGAYEINNISKIIRITAIIVLAYLGPAAIKQYPQNEYREIREIDRERERVEINFRMRKKGHTL